MSIAPSIYDFFGTLIPGLLYLYVINELLIAFHLRAIDLAQLDKVPNMVLVALAAFICGHLANAITFRYWYCLFVRDNMRQVGLQKVISRNPDCDIRFRPSDSRPLMTIIRHLTPDVAKNIEMLQANSIMMRNISLAAALYVVLQIVLAVGSPSITPYLVTMVLGVLASALAMNRAKRYEYWFHRDIFMEALNYGQSLAEIHEAVWKLTRPSSKAAKTAKAAARTTVGPESSEKSPAKLN